MSARSATDPISAPHPRPHLRAWPALLVAPIAFMVNLIITYPLVPWVCAHQAGFVLHLTEAVFLVIALVGAWHGLRLWHAHRAAAGSDAGDRATQEQLLGIIGTLTSAIFSLAMLAQWFTAFVVPACLS